MKRFQKKTICMMGLMMLLLGFASCEKTKDESTINVDSGVITEVPEPDVWVTDDDVKEADLDLLVDLSVKMERVRQEFVKMLSNGGEGDKPFCGVGPKTDVGPTMKLLTDMLGKEEEYEAALGRLDETRVMKPSATRDGWLGDLRDILFTGRAEAKKEQEKVKDVLLSINAYGNADAQKQLYDFYCSQEPEYAKKIGAKDAKDFFNKLNNGELTSYALNISHIWRDKGLLMADQPNNAVGEYATVAFTGHIEYGKSAYRVSSKVAVAAGNLYLSGVDKLAGGWGAKIMEWSDAIGNKITKLKLMRKTLQGKPDWQGWNEYILNSLKDDIKTAIGEAFGDDAGFEKELVDQATEEMLSWVVKQCTENEDDAGDDPEAAEEKKDKLAKEDNLAILNIETDFSSEGKMILITDENTGQVHIGTPTYDGHFSLATTPGTKMITVIKKNGQRLTKRVTLVEGTNNIILKGGIDPYINLNPSNFTLECKAGSETAIVLTNCKYVKLTRTEKLDWCDVQLEINGSAGRGVHVRVNAKANLEDKERQGTFTLEGYKDKNDAKPAVTNTFKYTQDAYTTELTPIGVSPTSLLFDANGGEKTVKVDIKSYKYCGVTSDEKYDSWLTATANDDATITVKVAPNETGEERTAVIYAFGTDYQNVESLDQVAFKAIPITQKAGEGSDVKLAIESIRIQPNVHFMWAGHEDMTNDYWSILPNYFVTLNKFEIVEETNNYMRISCSFDEKSQESSITREKDATAIIEIENISDVYENWVIKSVDLNLHNYYKDSSSSSWGEEKTNFKASNIPFKGYASKKEFVYSGKKVNGVSGFGFSGTCSGNNGVEDSSYTLSLKDHEENEVIVNIKMAE